MSSGVDERSKGAAAPARRRHDSQASREALLRAAEELFDERGYDGATVRDIGERAAVDPALIARYFGCKEKLYLAALARSDRSLVASGAVELVAQMLRHSESKGHGPIGLAMVSPTLTDSAREQVRDVMRQRVLEPLTAILREQGAADPELRAELVVAVALGVALTRSSGTLPALAEASLGDVLRVLEPAVDELEGGAA